MPLPTSLKTVPVHGKYVVPDGTAPTGTVTFIVPGPLRADDDDTIVIPGKYTATLDSAGEFTVTLPATDDPDIAPNSWQYVVHEKLSIHERSYKLSVPAATVGTLELSDVAPV
ncbi:hypothetical protein GCM10012275_52960 [Longimycelium tulufanense]|uniref:Uncharacterized protein n=1 Tax=Longimycelium tulufanense TaxID=907463 RepID=A0A8J3CHD8_9PSEU|nr:hypothetical protein [Longimycelium tulufanense]GGM75677.1 hypothetical protein GCM10012275_52960 [Longimycelium tulufanense]